MKKIFLSYRVLPLSIFIGLGIVIVIYAFANVAYFTLLTPKEMIESSAVAFVKLKKKKKKNFIYFLF